MPVYATAPWPPISVAERPLLNSLARRCAINYLSIFCRELLIYRPSRPRYVPCLAGSFRRLARSRRPPRSPVSGRLCIFDFQRNLYPFHQPCSLDFLFLVLFRGLIRHSNHRSSAPTAAPGLRRALASTVERRARLYFPEV